MSDGEVRGGEEEEGSEVKSGVIRPMEARGLLIVAQVAKYGIHRIGKPHAFS